MIKRFNLRNTFCLIKNLCYYKNMKVAATIEARMGSSRLPGKVMLPINGQPVLYHIINRLRLSKEIDEIDVITSKKNENLIIKGFCEKINVNCFMGD